MSEINEKYIKSLISLKEDYWENDFNTNCYAFALGLDIPEEEICKNAYQLGFIAAKKFNISIQEVLKLSLEDRFLLDLKAIKIAYYEIDEEQSAGMYHLGNYVCHHWDISLYSNGKDFHFMRCNYNGELYHKVGNLGGPKKCEETIEYLTQYRLIRKYRLRYWEKENL